MNTTYCNIVSAERAIFSGEARMVIATGSLGELGIAPGHAPLLTGIEPGSVRVILADGSEEIFFVSGGFLEVQPGVVTLLADTVQRAADIDAAAAEEARERAQRDMENRETEVDFSLAATQLAEAAARLRTLEKLRKK